VNEHDTMPPLLYVVAPPHNHGQRHKTPIARLLSKGCKKVAVAASKDGSINNSRRIRAIYAITPSGTPAVPRQHSLYRWDSLSCC
jgi:hypothetical protein